VWSPNLKNKLARCGGSSPNIRGARGSRTPLASPPLPTCADSFRPDIFTGRRWNSFARINGPARLISGVKAPEAAPGYQPVASDWPEPESDQAGKTCREDLVAPSTRINANRLLLLK
jgi:hypothetical protein